MRYLSSIVAYAFLLLVSFSSHAEYLVNVSSSFGVDGNEKVIFAKSFQSAAAPNLGVFDGSLEVVEAIYPAKKDWGNVYAEWCYPGGDSEGSVSWWTNGDSSRNHFVKTGKKLKHLDDSTVLVKFSFGGEINSVMDISDISYGSPANGRNIDTDAESEAKRWRPRPKPSAEGFHSLDISKLLMGVSYSNESDSDHAYIATLRAMASVIQKQIAEYEFMKAGVAITECKRRVIYPVDKLGIFQGINSLKRSEGVFGSRFSSQLRY